MAGWLISLKAGPKDELKFVKFYFENRLYGYRFPREKPKKRWASAQWNTIADFSLFEVGDLIFFFCKRNIYGIGKVIEPTKGYGDNPVLCNYRGCLLPENTLDNPSICLWDEQFRRGLWSEKEKLESDIRLIVFFEPCPAFFTTGLDMDFVLQSDIGGIARQIRTFEGVGFIKLEEGDVDVLVELFTRNTGNNTPGFPSDEETHKRIKGILLKDEGGRYRFDPHILFEKYSDNGLFDQEGLLQIAIAHGLTTGSNNVNGVLGNWDYICNQVKVSPLKPVSYMDKADIFGLSHKSLNKQRLRSAVDRFLIAELKKDSFETAKPGTQRAEKIKNITKVPLLPLFNC